jgi:hypothetical protein
MRSTKSFLFRCFFSTSLLLLPALAFSPATSFVPSTVRRSTAVFLSDIPNNDKADDAFFKLPPPPEDQLVLSGDIMSLFVYGFFDHFISQDCASLFVSFSDSPQRLQAAAEQSQVLLNTPVWLSATSTYKDHIYQVLLSDQTVAQYSPLLQPIGLATILLASSWLVAGWFHHAFSFKNTLDCSTAKALAVTGKTWLSTCGIMLTMVGLSHVLCGCEWTHFTKGDVDYILDSLTVLTVWRFMASSILGYGSDDE